jgi:hypothetical protein
MWGAGMLGLIASCAVIRATPASPERPLEVAQLEAVRIQLTVAYARAADVVQDQRLSPGAAQGVYLALGRAETALAIAEAEREARPSVSAAYTATALEAILGVLDDLQRVEATPAPTQGSDEGHDSSTTRLFREGAGRAGGTAAVLAAQN